MQTSTNFSPSMHPFLPPRGSEALAALKDGGIVLLPTANLWQLISSTRSPEAISRQLRLCPPDGRARPELLFSDLEMMRAYLPHLHPKLENLLVFHKRPLTVLLKGSRNFTTSIQDENGLIAVRLIHDSLCHQLAEDLDAPLLATFARAPGAEFMPLGFGQIRSDVLQGVDHVVRRRQKGMVGEAPAVVIRLDENDNVVFVE